MASPRLEISALGDHRARADAVSRVARTFSSLSPGRRQDLVDVTGALLGSGASSSRRQPTRLMVEMDRGRLRGEVDYRKVRRLSGWVRSLAPVTALARNWGVDASRSGVWFDLGR